ncbi:hypothetical protein J6590_096503 [Homalodisca vitripennis]|nr:hypothetical protein J6590_098298 [Homalodisca vitripennis]KAG8324259.1 hypothetical protein J6590_096503 [Homalodisca vitripennis]
MLFYDKEAKPSRINAHQPTPCEKTVHPPHSQGPKPWCRSRCFRQVIKLILFLHCLVDDVADGSERRELVLSIYLGIYKAFDCVHYETLLHQLVKCGIWRLLHLWLTSYLKEQDQCVEISHIGTTKL